MRPKPTPVFHCGYQGNVISIWLALFLSFTFTSPNACAADDVVVRPKPAAGPLDNPLKGWCPYANAGPIDQPYSMVFQYISWRELEPIENDYRFEAWEESWNSEAAKDKHVIFRVYIDYPKKKSGLPDWLRNSGVGETAYDDHGGGMSPDYNHPRMVESMERLIAALGRRYNSDPRIAFIQVGLLGFWGEWHTYPRSELYASAKTEQRVVEAYRRAFPDKSLMVRYARGFAGDQDWIGFHDDMFPEDTDNGRDWSFLAGIRKSGRSDNWKHAVVGGEMVPGKAKQWLGPHYETTMTMLERSHFTWVGPYCPALTVDADKEFRDRSEAMVRKLGYQFRIDEVSHPAKASRSASILFKVENTGVAPFYYPWSVEWALIDSTGKLVHSHQTNWDIRRWQPGMFSENTKLEFDVPPGRYRLAIGIRDPWLNRPAIRFASALPVVDGWTIVSQLEVE